MMFLMRIVGIGIFCLFLYALIRESIRDGIYDAYKKIEKDKNKQ